MFRGVSGNDLDSDFLRFKELSCCKWLYRLGEVNLDK